ncbi:MAG TPA: MauE/DoxX family redox-associated membrane protein [Gaiellaceae bacterium]|jgi:peroxiredoxin/uncharacterized membrane protein YphA (DoxX/SURF4 family)
MPAILLACRLVLAGVFAVAAATKLAAPDETQATLVAFGLREQAARFSAPLLPVAEGAVAVALLVGDASHIAGAAAAALLLLFSAAVAVNLARGRTPNCNCFGAVHSKPIGPVTLARNLSLAALALLIAARGSGTSAFAWLGRLSTADLALTLAVAGLAVALGVVASFAFALFRRHGALLLRVDALETGAPVPMVAQYGLAVGTPAPDFALQGLDGETMTLAALRSHGRRVLLLFTDPQCGPCNALLPEFGGWQREYEQALTVGIISRRDPEANRPKAKEHGLVNVLLQQEDEIAQSFGVNGTPGAVLVGADGAVASTAAMGADAIRALVQSATFRPAAAGAEAPDFALTDVRGRERTLGEFRGRELMLLFWNPSCGFCNAMTEDLRRLDAFAGSGGMPELVVLTAADGVPPLRSPVLVDQPMAVGASFGANGTPMAVRVSAEGMIASEVAAGAEQVLALAGLSPAQSPAS